MLLFIPHSKKRSTDSNHCLVLYDINSPVKGFLKSRTINTVIRVVIGLVRCPRYKRKETYLEAIELDNRDVFTEPRQGKITLYLLFMSTRCKEYTAFYDLIALSSHYAPPIIPLPLLRRKALS